jgi:hypothetical protein
MWAVEFAQFNAGKRSWDCLFGAREVNGGARSWQLRENLTTGWHIAPFTF